uniref:RAB44, member RAS oncogene family n=1 Tax=Gasterosteus aculeatus aculeatus TaxID=481459 RepID=A0AAQ4QU35_GASAC
MFISSTTEITTESIHTAENTANECSLQGTISSPKVEMPAEVEQNEYLHLSEVAQAHLEDAVNKGHENEIKLMGMHEIAYSSESVVHDGKSDNDHVYDTRKPQSSDIERDDPALRQVFEVEGTVEEQDVEPNEGQDNLPKVTAGDHSEAAVNKLQPTENQEKPQIDFSPENVTHDATDKSEIISGKTMDQTEVSDTYQYEMKVTNALDSPINRDNSNSDNTQEEHPKKENIFETSDQRNEDYDVCDIKKTQISDTDRVDTFHVFEGDTNPSDEQTGYQENEELLEESGSSLQTLQSEINVPSDPQLLQKDSSFHSIGHRRKMGSSRKSKGRPHVKDSGAESDQEPTVDVVGNTRDNETQEGTEMALEIKTEVQEKSMETLLKETDTFDLTQTEGVSEEVKGNAQDDTLVGIADLNSLGLQSSLTTAHLEIDQSNVRDDRDEEPPNLCSVTEKENEEGAEDTEPFRPDGSLPDKYLLREDMESSFPPEKTTEELSSREPTEPECSVQQDSLSPQKEEVHTNEGQDDNSNLPKVTGDVNSKLMDQTEVSDTYLYKLAVTNTDGSPISLEESGSSLQTLQSEINVPSDPQLLQKDSSFHSIGHRRKMGSSRKSKGRPYVKDSGAESDQEPTVDVVGNTRDNETQEGTEMAIEIKTEVQENSMETLLKETDTFDLTQTEVQEKSMETLLKETDTFDLTQTEGVSEEVKGNAQDDTLVGIADLNSLGLQSSLTTAHLEIDQSNVRDDPDEEPPNLCSVTEKENEEGAEDTEPFRPDGSLPDKYLLREDMESSFPPEKTTEELSSREPTEPECSVQQDSLSPQKEEVHTNEGQDDNSNLPKVTGDVNSKLMDQTEVSDTYLYKLAVTNTDGSPISLEESGSSLQTLQSEINVPSDPQLLQKDSSFHSIGHRRKMGSSRKSKGRPHVKDSGAESDQEPTVDVVGNTRDNETQEGTEMALEIKTEVQEKSMETLLKETDTFDLTQTEGVSDQVKGNAQDDNRVSIDLTSSSSAVDRQIVEHSNFRQTSDKELPKVCCVTEKDNRESSVALEISTERRPEEHNETECTVEQAEFSPLEDKLSINEGQKQPVTGTWHSHKSINQTKKEHESQETNVSKEIPKVELFSAPPTLDPCDFGLKQAETTVDVSEQSGTSSLQGMQEPNNSDDIVILHGRSTQKRRKMGSTRQTQFSGKRREKRAQTQESDPEADTGNLDRMEKVEELTTISTAEVSQSENAKLPPSVVYKEQQETNEARAEEKKLIGLFKDTSKALPPEQSASLSEEVVDPVEFVAADAKHHKGNAAVSGEPSHYTSPTEVLNTTNPRLSSSKDTPNYSMTGAASVTACEPTKSTRNDEERVENVDITKDIALISTEACVVADLETVKSGTERGAAEEHITTQAMELEPDNAEEAAPSRDPDMENAGPCLDPKNRRRKMGSTRRNLRTGSKQEDSHQTQDVSDRVTETVTNVADVRIESSSSKKDELQVDAADKDGGTETTESSHTSESHKPPPHRTFEENPVSQGRMLETEHQAAPSYLSAEPSTPPKDGLIAESAFGGRRRKMGSNRKSHQSHETQTARVDKMKDTQNERDVRSIREENPIETEELREESSKVDQSHKKQLANLSSSKEGDDATPVSEKTPEPVTAAQQYAGFQSQMFSLEERSDLRSKAYNVMMVGDSSVGKSSFMKRAQSGKFSLDLPASVGLDYCMWTVLVEGKPVVLQLWDTAGQERFHSITKQTFHKAHAFLLMYDITCSQSFFAVSYWERCIREAAAEGVTIILVGNKSDGAERQVKSQEADILAAEYKFEFMECSAATGENVVQCLETVARMLSQKDETREDNMVLRKEPQQKTKSRCC